jgi:RNA 2',3'-cyclic 3'-phosphodiesterase
MRLFIGIPLTGTVERELSAVSVRLRSSNDGLRWSAPESWHVTLQFLGSTSPEQCRCVADSLRLIHSPPVPIQLESLGFFDRAGVFFAGVRLTPELTTLQQRVIAATAPCGFPSEERDYHPHITLARSKGKEGRHGIQRLKGETHRQPAFSAIDAREFLLYESFTRPSGSQYEVRERFPFTGI